MMRTLQKIVVEHNGWCDEEGVPSPPANTDAFWDAIPDELAATLITLLRFEVENWPAR
jgi:hypothetical protein